MIKVITYNILSPNLCYPEEFQNYDSQDLDSQSRKNKIVLLIDEWTSQEPFPIIALQEVPFSWKGILEKLFLNRNYHFFTMNYGYKKNGYFGVAVAVPYSYQIDKIEYLPIADFIPDGPSDNLQANYMSFFIEKWVNNFMNPPEINYFQEAKKRPNFLIRLTLTKDFQFTFYNYHMPCAFKTPVIQTLHLQALKEIFSENELPFIFASDLNIIPHSQGYNFLILNEIPKDQEKYISPNKPSSSVLKIRSTYQMVNQEEPPFTCFSHTNWGGLFKNTLDYIFVSKHFEAISSKLLITSEEKMPNKISPSDHLPLQSEVQLIV